MEIGDVIFAKNKSRANNYYAIKIVDQIGEKVKIDSKLFRIENEELAKLSDVEKNELRNPQHRSVLSEYLGEGT